MEYTIYIVVLNEDGKEETIPLKLAERNFLEDAIEFREDINTLFGEID